MSKLKLLLLGGVFTLVGIFNFSSAYEITNNYTFSNYGDSVTLNSSDVVKIVCNSDSGRLRVWTQQPPYEVQGDVLVCPGTKNVKKRYNILSMSLMEGNNVSFSVFLDSPTLPFNQLFVLLTPAVDSLKGVVYQIIPYVVYIGIGLLVCTLGFIAIRWLVNWIVKKLNSVFSSRK